MMLSIKLFLMIFISFTIYLSESYEFIEEFYVPNSLRLKDNYYVNCTLKIDDSKDEHLFLLTLSKDNLTFYSCDWNCKRFMS
jgi:hypothetical protein